jgi:peptidyl-prolyl cis-trans isomerase A (cyclophilin A)
LLPAKKSGEFPPVRLLALVFTLICPLQAELVARFHTTQGTVDVVLQFTTAPQAVANFITLAQGSRPWVDSSNGRIRTDPFYNGIKIHRTSNTDGFKFAQGGSLKGDGSDGPGYTFKDEFNSPLIHVPYVLSMANAGPNTNGSQFFFTGSLPQPTFDNVHTIFGLVTDLASQRVVDAMIAAGPNGTTINGVTFTRTDADAISFDEHAQNLPVCAGAIGRLAVTLGVKTQYVLDSPMPAGSILQVFRSPDLQGWAKLGEIYQGTGASRSDSITFDNATLPRAFYQIPLVTYPDALAPASLANRTLVMGLPGSETMTYQFNSLGTGGTATYSANPANPAPITSVSYTRSPYKATWVINTAGYVPFRYQGILNTQDPTHILGTNTSETSNGLFWSALGSGSLSLTK